MTGRRIRTGLWILAALGAGFLVSRGVAAQTPIETEIQDQRSQLEELKRQAEASRKKARALAQKEQGVVARLSQAEEALTATRRYIERLEGRHFEVQEEIRRTLLDLSWAQDELTTRREELSRRLRFAYMYNKTRSLEVVFSADSFPSLLQRSAFLSRVVQQDRKLVDMVAARETEVQRKLAALEGQREELDRLAAEKVEEERQYGALKADREGDLKKVRNQKSTHERAAKELDAAAREMEQLLAELERKRQEALRRNNPVLTELDRVDFGNNRGRLPWPALGKLLTGFGRQEHPKYKTVTISNGIDIASPVGTEVRAVGSGLVDLVDWLPGYGQTVIVNHGRSYYSIYGHLSATAVRPGDQVTAGRLLGEVGDTGSLKGACLHFEVRHGGVPQDPIAWLRP